jgi:hypothetical protein
MNPLYASFRSLKQLPSFCDGPRPGSRNATVKLRYSEGSFVLGMAMHREAHAQLAPHPTSIYYCATGEEIPLYEPCKDRKDQRDI